MRIKEKLIIWTIRKLFTKIDHRKIHLWDEEKVNLKRLDLKWAHLEGSDLESANLERAHLCGAKLEGAKLDHANLDWTSIEGASVENITMTKEQLDEINETAIIVEGQYENYCQC